MFSVSCPDPDPEDPVDPVETLYDITISPPTADNDCSYTIRVGNGAAVNTSTKAAAGQTITLTAVLEAGFELVNFIVTPTQTLSGSGNTWTFTMPAMNVSISAVFQAAITKYSIVRGTSVNGNFTIDPADQRAAEGDTVTLVPTANEGYQFDSWLIDPQQAVTKDGDAYKFTMPDADVTVNAVFSEQGTGDGVKTITFESGLGRTSEKNTGADVYDGTRHMTLTVTMAAGNITNIATGHPDIIINHPVTGWADQYNNHNPYRTQTTSLIEAIRTSRNPDVDFTVSGLSGEALAGWEKHETQV